LGIVKTRARGVSYLSVHLRFGTISIREPWKMSLEEQRAAAVSIGLGYPSPIVDHEAARKRTLELYRKVRKS
jgi:deoxyribodipyrimidine photolyase